MGRSRHLFLLFFLSGVSGLIYESLWSRYLKLFVGSAATAQILVLALFMGGMSLGSLLAGRYSERVKRPVLTYGVIEGMIGAYALAFPFVYEIVTRLAWDTLLPATGGGVTLSVVKWGLAALMIAPPCIMLGTTFPLMSVGILRRDRKRSGEILSFLYFSNSFGAALGALVSGFVLVPRFGLPGTLMCAAGLNLAIMVVCLRERKRDVDPPLERTGSEPEDESAGPDEETVKVDALSESKIAKTEASQSLLPLMLAIALGTGLSSFMYEIGWIRMLSMILGSATRSFEVMLSAFVFGLAAGGLWVRKRMDKFKNPELTLGKVQLWMGILAVATLPLYRLGVLGVGGIFEYWDGDRTVEGWITFNILRYLICLLIMLPATFCAGMTLPLVTHVLLRRGQPESAIGRVYGVNTLGAIAGAITAGIILLPLIGIKKVIVCGALIDMALGVWIVVRESQKAPKDRSLKMFVKTTTLGSIGVAIVGLFVLEIDPRVLASGVYRRGTTQMHEDFQVVRHVDGRTASVTVTHDLARPGYHALYTNGKPDASVRVNKWPEGRDPREGPALAGDDPTQIMLGLIPLMARPESTEFAMIGIGSGVSTHTLLGSPVIERMDTVEIEPEMAESSRLFDPANHRTFNDPRSHIIFDDAKAYFAAAKASYDFILSEPSNPWVSGVSSLFTIEFYREIKRYMKPNGVLGQWMHGYELSDELLLSVLAAVDQSFGDYRIYRVGSRDWLILTTVEPDGVGDLDPSVLEWDVIKDDAALLGVVDPGQIDALVVANTTLLRPYLSSLTPNTDAMPLLDNGAERARFFRESAEALLELRFFPLPIVEVLGGVDRRPYAIGMPERRKKKHVLEEPERALRMLGAHQTVDRSDVWGTGPMRVYFTQRDNIERKPADGETSRAWFYAVFEVFSEVAPWVDVSVQTWWTEIVKESKGARLSDEAKAGVALLDALVRRDSPAMLELVYERLEDGPSDPLFSPRFVELTGAVALELSGASVTDKREYAEQHMKPLDAGEASEDIAYRVVVEWMSQ